MLEGARDSDQEAFERAMESHMRYAALVLPLLLLGSSVRAVVAPEIDPRASLGVVQQWIYGYRAKPDYAHVPAAVRVLFHSQTFKEPESAGIYLGFIAGAIGSNPAKAEQLVNSFFPVPPQDEWVERVFDICKTHLGTRPEGRTATYMTDAANLLKAYRGAPTIVLGPGEPQMAHQTDEYCTMERIEVAVEAYEQLIRRWCSA